MWDLNAIGQKGFFTRATSLLLSIKAWCFCQIVESQQLGKWVTMGPQWNLATEWLDITGDEFRLWGEVHLLEESQINRQERWVVGTAGR